MPVTRSQRGNTIAPKGEHDDEYAATVPLSSAAGTSALLPGVEAGSVRLSRTEVEPATLHRMLPFRHEETPKSLTVPLRSMTQPPVQVHYKSKSSSTKSDRAKRLAKAAEKIAQRKLELAMAKMRAIEAESEEEEDNASVVESQGAEHRVTSWLHQQRVKTPPPSTTLPDGEAVTLQTAPMVTYTAMESPKILSAPIEATSSKSPQQHLPIQLEIAQLASAITEAARSAVPVASSRYIGELPIFNGANTEWLAFRSAYLESASILTHNENIARIRRALRGKAKEAVASLMIANQPPADIMKALEARFGRPDAIAITEIEKIKNLPRTSDVPREICTFANRIQNSVATLQLLGKEKYLYSPEIMKSLIEKITPTTRYRWFDYAEKLEERQRNEPELLQFSKFIENEAQMCARYAAPEAINMEEHVQTSAPRRQRTFTNANSKNVSNVPNNSTRREVKWPCSICKEQGHAPMDCTQFKNATSEVRWELAREHRLCFRCLKFKNTTHRCKNRKCDQEGCVRSHHPSLHFDKIKENSAPEPAEKVNTSLNRRCHTFLKVVPVIISGPKGHENTYALLDDGSTVTLIEAAIAKRIGAEGPVEPLEIETVASSNVKIGTSQRIKVSLQGQDTETYQIYGRTMKNLNLSPQTINEEIVWNCNHLQDLKRFFNYDEEMKPMIIIGQDNWHLLISSEVRHGNNRQLAASKTSLGWALHGADTRIIGHKVHFVNRLNHTQESNDRMDLLLKRHFELESLGIEKRQPQSDPDRQAIEILEKGTKKIGDRFETPLLWRNQDAVMPNNYENAMARLKNTENKIDKDPHLRERYSAQMEDLIKKGYAERAPTKSSIGKTWYLPHFPVFNPRKPNKLRIVHDAAATTKGVSLNDYLLTGPDQLQSLPGVLMRFRQHPVAVTADIAEMFMRVGVLEKDRDALRFLWRGNKRDGPPEEYRMRSVIFGATSSPATAIFVKNLNARQHLDTHPAAATAIIQSHYMDDYLQSFSFEEEAIWIAKQVHKIHKEANFNLRGWASNSSEVLNQIESQPIDKREVRINHNVGSNEEKVLGLVWKTSQDELAFNLDLAKVPDSLIEKEIPTKRDILKIVMSVYDPLGFATPVVIQAKRIIQEIWRRGSDWDQAIDEDLIKQWNVWLGHLKNLRTTSIPRAYRSYSPAIKIELHTFVDASATTYAAALYWRAEAPDGTAHLSLITAKARVAPLKLISIPRLELQGAVLGARMASAVIEEHERKPDRKTFWTDSRTVLAWLRNGSRSYKPFVAHRLAAIEELSPVKEWRWLPSKLNVADDATRDVPPEFGNKHRWFTGPEFLLEPSASWPEEPTTPLSTDNTLEERVHSTNINRKLMIENAIPDVNRFSKWEHYVRSTARVLQFIELCRPQKQRVNYKRNRKNLEKDPDWRKQKKAPKIQKKKSVVRVTRDYRILESEILVKAEKLIVLSIQKNAFAEELEAIAKGKQVPINSRLHQLSTVTIDGVLHLKSRISVAVGVTVNQKSPAIIDGNHPATKLWIEHVHRSLHHAGIETTVNECRQQYWVLRLRPIVRVIVRSCLPCRIRKAAPSSPPTGDHPPSRLAHHQRPFTFTGVDYFGPISITVGRQHHKRYVALFTCLTTRAVHLEPVASLSTDSAILALRRMIARRGCPTEIWSDNGTNFHGADSELRRAALGACEEEANIRAIAWRFIPPAAPFMGGVWERLVRSVKTALAAVLEDRYPTEEVLTTLLAEAEYTVNSRPLTHVSVHHEDDEALTPNHFLLGGSARVPNPGAFTEDDLCNRSHWRASQRLADLFWARWVREYLPELQHRREPQGRGLPINTGDVVLVADSNLPRNTWPRGVVIACHPGRDGIVRVVDIRTKGGVLRRPTKRLVVLPIHRVASTPET